MNITSTAELGACVREIRRQIGVTQADLALTSGTGVRFIIDLERGKPTCQIGKVIRVLRTLGVDLALVPPADLPMPIDS
jgi:y4mF family transcriptional regulator